MPDSTSEQKGRMGHTRQKGSLMLLTIPGSVPAGPPATVPGINSVPKIEYEPKITLRIRKVAMIMYRDWLSFLFVDSENVRCLSLVTLRIRVSTSWNKPNGQSQPQ